MSNVYVSDLRVPRTPRNHRHYDGIGGSNFSATTVTGGVTNPPVLVTPKDIIAFTNTDTPTITAYNTTWAATHGQYPNVRLFIIIDSNSSFECRKVDPIFTYVDGLIDTISFDYGDQNVACFIILN